MRVRRARRTFESNDGFSLVSFENCSLAFAEVTMPSMPTLTEGLAKTWDVILQKLQERACNFAEAQVNRIDNKLQRAATFQIDTPYGISAEIGPGTLGAFGTGAEGGSSDFSTDQGIIQYDEEEAAEYAADAVSNRAYQWFQQQDQIQEFYDELDRLGREVDEAERELEKKLQNTDALPDRSPDEYDDY